MCALPNTTWFWECDAHDVYREGMGMERARAWKGAGMERVWAWKGRGHGQGADEGVAGTWLTLPYELGAWATVRKDGSQGAWRGTV